MTTPSHPVDPPKAPLLRLAEVGKTYPGGVAALESIDLSVRRGEFLCLVGSSGCGKSTLLRIVAGLADATSGAVAWSESTAAGDIGFVFQEPTLMPWSRVWKNVWLPLRLRGQSRRDARPAIDAALEQVGLTEFAQAYPRQLSGGMRMRVAIARALVTRPRLLLMDEPFAALDEITRFRLNDDLLRLWDEQGLTVLFVTHSVYESAYLAQRVVVMAPRPGRLVREVNIAGPRPRDESFRRAPIYADACQAISAALREASEQRG